MIKKAVLLSTLTPFLMVFSDYSSAITRGSDMCHIDADAHDADPPFEWEILKPVNGSNDVRCENESEFTGRYNYVVSLGVPYYMTRRYHRYGDFCRFYGKLDGEVNHSDYSSPAGSCGVFYNTDFTDEQCSVSDGSSLSSIPPETYNYLINGGSIRTNSGACSVSYSGGVSGCNPVDGLCSLDIESVSSGELTAPGFAIEGGLSSGTPSEFETDFSPPEYLSPLDGVQCNDPSVCVSIGDNTYLVDWDSAPDWFEYVGSDGNTYSKPSSGGDNGGDTGGGDPTDPTNPTDPTDPGGNGGGGSDGDSGDSDGGNDSGGGGSGGGSTVPDFEFDESGIIEAIGSAGQSNRNAINALSNDVTSSINNQTNELNNATSAQTDALSGALSNQTNTLSNSLDSQTDTITGALNDQTGTLSGSLDALGTSIVDAINAFGAGSGEGDAEDGDGHGLLAGISRLLNGMVDNLASQFTEDLGTGDDLFNSSGLDDTLDNMAFQEDQYSDDVNTLMDEIGDGASSSIAEEVTSRLPSLPSGGCVPLTFGPMEISCQAFNTIKLWLTWIVYFWTVVSIVDIFFRSEQRTA